MCKALYTGLECTIQKHTSSHHVHTIDIVQVQYIQSVLQLLFECLPACVVILQVPAHRQTHLSVSAIMTAQDQPVETPFERVAEAHKVHFTPPTEPERPAGDASPSSTASLHDIEDPSADQHAHILEPVDLERRVIVSCMGINAFVPTMLMPPSTLSKVTKGLKDCVHRGATPPGSPNMPQERQVVLVGGQRLEDV